MNCRKNSVYNETVNNVDNDDNMINDVKIIDTESLR
jgi:hypothetical protein